MIHPDLRVAPLVAWEQQVLVVVSPFSSLSSCEWYERCFQTCHFHVCKPAQDKAIKHLFEESKSDSTT